MAAATASSSRGFFTRSGPVSSEANTFFQWRPSGPFSASLPKPMVSPVSSGVPTPWVSPHLFMNPTTGSGYRSVLPYTSPTMRLLPWTVVKAARPMPLYVSPSLSVTEAPSSSMAVPANSMAQPSSARAFTAGPYWTKSPAANRWARSVPAPMKRKSAPAMSAPSPGRTGWTVMVQPSASRYRRSTDTLA